jgi:hypothetical protein
MLPLPERHRVWQRMLPIGRDVREWHLLSGRQCLRQHMLPAREFVFGRSLAERDDHVYLLQTSLPPGQGVRRRVLPA